MATVEEIRAEMARVEAARTLSREMFPNKSFPEISRQTVYFGRRTDVFMADGKVAIADIRKPEEPVLLAIASQDYKVVLHEEIIAAVVEACSELEHFGKPEYSLMLPWDGARFFLKVRFPEVNYQVGAKDTINPQIAIKSSYDLGWKLSSDFGAFRLICSNGMVIGKRFSRYVNRHISTLSVPKMIETVKEGMAAFDKETGLWKLWLEKKVNRDMYDNLWETLPFSEAEREKIEALPEAGTQLLLPDALNRNELNLWDMHNVVTQFATHNIGSEIRQAEIGATIAEAFDRAYWRR